MVVKGWRFHGTERYYVAQETGAVTNRGSDEDAGHITDSATEDPACGSGGMFVQTSHFIESLGKDTAHRVTFYGQEKTATTIRLAKMNLA
ncbi:MAG TPA: N-6 DNA methylase, partial [Terracidiphilus sp.]|nr:N-6 DNA methylase [Terracidiphilus sp.]